MLIHGRNCITSYWKTHVREIIYILISLGIYLVQDQNVLAVKCKVVRS